MIKRNLLLFLFCMSTSLTVLAQVPFPSFTPGQSASAEQVNANFSALVTQIGQLQAEIDELQAIVGAPTLATAEGTYKLFELTIDVDANGPESFSMAGASNTGTITLNANGTGNFQGTWDYRQVTFNSQTVNVSTPGGGSYNVESTDVAQFNTPEVENTNFTWAVNGRMITVTIPPEMEGEDPENITFYAASSQLFVSGGYGGEGQNALTIIIKQ